MVDKQQLAAMGEHVREMKECNQYKHSAAQVITWAGDYEKIGGHGLIVEMLKSYAEILAKSHCNPEFKVPDGWQLVPVEPTKAMLSAGDAQLAYDCCSGTADDAWRAMLAAAPEYKP